MPDGHCHVRGLSLLHRTEGFGRMEVDRNAQLRRGFEQPRLVALHVDAGEGLHALLCQASLSQGATEQIEYLVRAYPPATTDAGDERRWTVDDGRTGRLHEPVGDEDQGRLPFVRRDDVLW